MLFKIEKSHGWGHIAQKHVDIKSDILMTKRYEKYHSKYITIIQWSVNDTAGLPHTCAHTANTTCPDVLFSIWSICGNLINVWWVLIWTKAPANELVMTPNIMQACPLFAILNYSHENISILVKCWPWCLVVLWWSWVLPPVLAPAMYMGRHIRQF